MSGLEQWIKKDHEVGANSSETRLQSSNSVSNKQTQVKEKLSDSIESNPLWKVLVDTVESDILFSNRLAYVRQKIVPKHPDITPEELSELVGIPLGVSIVILHRLRQKNEEDSFFESSSSY